MAEIIDKEMTFKNNFNLLYFSKINSILIFSTFKLLKKTLN